MLVYQRVNLYFPMGFPMFSHFPSGFPMEISIHFQDHGLSHIVTPLFYIYLWDL